MLDQNRPKSYEWKIVILLAILWGTVGLDRLVIVYLFPILIPEFGLNNAQAGALTSVLAMTWAGSAWVLGSVSDRYGRKKVLLPAVVFFSLMSWLTGVAKSYGSLMAIRGLMGVGEGAVFSTSVATVAEESTPTKRGLNLGIHQSCFPLVGIGLGAIISTQLAQSFGWRPVFFIVGIPGLVLALFIAFIYEGTQINLSEICRQGIKLVSKSLRTAVFNGQNLKAREDMIVASMLGGMACGHQGTFPQGGCGKSGPGSGNAVQGCGLKRIIN